jgi:hypothetical protein
MVAIVLYSRLKLDLSTGLYDGFYQDIHVDEKWFFNKQDHLKLYLTQREVEENLVPNRQLPHKSHTMKVMFLAATAGSRYNNEGVEVFYGKIGI